MGSIVVRPWGLTGELQEGETILAHLQRLGVVLEARCGGKGECGACLVRVEAPPGVVTPPGPVERDWGLPAGCRLSCQAVVIDATAFLSVSLPDAQEYSILTGGTALDGESMADIVRGAPLPGRGFGLALDAGTTTLVLRWYDLSDPGRGPIHTAARLNPQVTFGDNVIDRVAYARASPGNEERLRDILIRTVGDMIVSGPVPPAEMGSMVIVGNSVMRDMVLGLPISGFGVSPFSSASPGAITITARQAGIPLAPGAIIYAPPVPGHFVGADMLAVILFTGMHRSTEPLLAIDIGTNTEIAVGSAEGILVTSCASGPAFEGAGVQSGTGAVPGAICTVTRGDEGDLVLTTIGGVPATGICGSGMIDTLAVMLREGIIEPSGRFTGSQKEFVLQEGSPAITLSGGDIDSLLLAKAAISTGTQALLENAGIPLSRLSRCLLAGAFGSSLSLENARAIGLIPPLPQEKLFRIGNAAVEGASLLLLDPAMRQEAEKAITRISHVSLEALPDFFDRFCDSLYFGVEPPA